MSALRTPVSRTPAATYTWLVARALRKLDNTVLDARWVLAWMIQEYPGVERLDGLNVVEFEEEVQSAVCMAMASTAAENEQLALSLGL